MSSHVGARGWTANYITMAVKRRVTHAIWKRIPTRPCISKVAMTWSSWTGPQEPHPSRNPSWHSDSQPPTVRNTSRTAMPPNRINGTMAACMYSPHVSAWHGRRFLKTQQNLFLQRRKPNDLKNVARHGPDKQGKG